jgi:tetratricopeptide (TPR) repeat protein
LIRRALAYFLSIFSLAHAGTYHSWQHNRAGLKAMGNKNNFGAYTEFLHALEDDPLNPDVQMNLGLSFEANEEWDKAEAAYRGVLKLAPENSALRFEALFNLARVYGQNKKIDLALETYQACLDMNPDSLEVKTNIELLWKGGGGGGNGENKDQKQNQKDDKDDKRSNQQKREDSLKNPPQDEQKNKQPKPFESQDLSKEDVKRILDEIKNQEQAIRANEYDKGAKEAPRGKDW